MCRCGFEFNSSSQGRCGRCGRELEGKAMAGTEEQAAADNGQAALEARAAVEYLNRARKTKGEIDRLNKKIDSKKKEIKEKKEAFGITELEEDLKALKASRSSIALETINASEDIQLPLEGIGEEGFDSEEEPEENEDLDEE